MSNVVPTKINLNNNYPELSEFIESNKLKKVYAQENLTFQIRIRIKQIIKEQELTQDQLAERMGVDQKQVHRLISGKGGFTLNTLQKFCYATGSRLELN